MRKFVISAAVLVSTLGVAAPAAAQWAPPPPQGYAYGYHNNYGQVRRLEARIQHIRHEIRRLDRRNILSEREARRLSDEARDLQRRVRQLAYNGISGRERYEIERRIDRLEYRVRREASDGNRRFGYNQQNWSDRDRDGRNDRYEDDRGRDHDGRRWDRDDD